MMSKIFSISPIPDFDGLISLKDGEFGKLSLWSVTVIKTSVSFIYLILSFIANFSSIFFASKLILLTLLLFTFL